MDRQGDQRLKIQITGKVQGVGFRPFIYRLAQELKLTGWVNNSAQGVLIEVEGNLFVLEQFLSRLQTENPPRSQINTLNFSYLQTIGYPDFTIQKSMGGEKTAIILPDLSTCSDCLQEIFDPHNRRYYYPFTNCTNCGPRYSIIEALPYDRVNTSMKGFQMCPTCEQEYENPRDRRFHAQPNACPDCGPQLALWNAQGDELATGYDALLATVKAIQDGKILAIKGLGGFHLVVDATQAIAVQTLRERKHRPDKPFALMYPNLGLIKHHCQVNELEEKLLLSPEAPIVLLKRKSFVNSEINLAAKIAPNNPYLGVMLPYTPLHYLLLAELKIPIVATSANLSDEPICIDEQEALTRLRKIADLFLIHNRPIVRPLDDSIVRVMNDQETVLRRARGYAPFSLALTHQSPIEKPILAVGAHLKNTIAIAAHQQVYLSQHIGDLSNIQTYQAFQNTFQSLANLYEFQPEIIAHDAHPQYLSTQYAQSQNLPLVAVNHHYAHILACLADNQLILPVLGIAWDGTGYGLDRTIWGGEFIQVTENQWERIAYFHPFKLLGGEIAIKQPHRIALSLLAELNQDPLSILPDCLKTQFTLQELTLLKLVLEKDLNNPVTSSVGRLFDGVAAILGLIHQVTFEGQAAMTVEFSALDIQTDDFYPFSIQKQPNHPSHIIQWQPILSAILEDIQQGVSVNCIAAKFHNSLVEIMVAIAQLVGESNVLLTGGCFQNRYLTERAIDRLKAEGFVPHWHHQIPPNDGGIALGQVLAALFLQSR
ncbi:MAG: carbamoyltransferase HypF [Snowella sp.]|nr:carbamoyltransferase HypF [Snowella sp.]